MASKDRRGANRRVLAGLFAAALLVAGVSIGPVGAAPVQQDERQIDEVAQAEPSPAVPVAPRAQSPLVGEVVRPVNVERAKEGAPPLQTDDRLMRAAQEYSGVLGQGECFEHTCLPVPELRARLANVGYVDFSRIGENIAGGDNTAEDVVQGWMGSPGHRRNILAPDYQEIGVGVTRSEAHYRIYWVQVFGARAQ